MDQTVSVDAVHTELGTIGRGVPAVLDAEAGLRDILLPVRYDDLAGALAGLVDTEAGLAALLGTDHRP